MNQKTFRLEVHSDGISDLIFDLADEKVNKFSTPVMEELSHVLDELKDNVKIKVLVIRSTKRDIFIAGADIAEIAGIREEETGRRLAEKGQAIFNKLENLPFPTVAVIHGACLGGGLEFSLACTFRIASDHPKTQLGLPEVNLGVVPGFGGTQRLPRLIGLSQALPMILTGKPVNGSKAYKIKLVDACIASEFFTERVNDFVQGILDPQKRRWILQRRKTSSWFLDKTSLGQTLVFQRAQKDLREKTHGQYPAPLKAVDVIRKTLNGSIKKGLAIEAQALGALAITSVCKNLIQIFYAQEALRKDSGIKGDSQLKLIQSAGVLGAGVMGGGIAWLFSSVEIPVRMKDINWEAMAKGFQSAEGMYRQLLKIRKMKESEVNLKMLRISGGLDYAGFKGLDIIIEAIVENLQVKKKVLAEVEPQVRDDAILASNTSALSIDQMSSALKHPERFIGMHFFNPVNRMPLVEVIPGQKTSLETVATLVAFVKTLKKTPVVVKNCAGFLVNRILLPYMNEAAHLLEEGADLGFVDRCILRFGMPMGPFSLTDEVGIDVGYHVAKTLSESYGERMAVAGILQIIAMEKKMLGKKGQKGFYLYQGKAKRVNPEIAGIIKSYQDQHPVKQKNINEELILDRCLLMMVNEAARCMEENVIAKAEYLDMAMILGTGFPPFRGGILRYTDQREIRSVVDRLNYLSESEGPRFQPSALLISMAKNNRKFYNS